MEIEFYYFTTWKKCFLHFRQKAKNEWDDYEMQVVGQEREGWMYASIESEIGIEFVLCNQNKTEWDNPPYWYGKQNYEIDVSKLKGGYIPPKRMFVPVGKNNTNENLLNTLENENKKSMLTNGYVLNCVENIKNMQNNNNVDIEKRKNGKRVVCTLVDGEINIIDEGNEKCILLITDLDGTLLGRDDYLNLFQNHWKKKHIWRGSILAYNTGRNLKDFLLAAGAYNLAKPDFAILGVGTEIYTFPGVEALENSHLNYFDISDEIKEKAEEEMCTFKYPSWCPSRFFAKFDPFWLEVMKSSFDRKKIEDVVHKNFPDFFVNGNILYDPFRTSLSAPYDKINTQKLFEDFPDCFIIISGSGEWRFVDVAPKKGGKLAASEYLMHKLNFESSSTLVCGDSGNDIDMFALENVKGVCVANSHNELIFFVNQNFDNLDPNTEAIIKIRNLIPSPYILKAKYDCAGGILEALKHFNFDKEIPLKENHKVT